MLFCLSCQGSVYNVDTTKAVTALGLSKLEFILSKWNWRRTEILIFRCCSDLRFEVGILTPCLVRNNTWGEGARFLLWTHSPLMDLAPCGWESSHKRQPADSCVLVGFGFVVFFSGQYLQGSDLFPREILGWHRVQQWSRGGPQGSCFWPVQYSLWADCFSFAIKLSTFFHACFPENRSEY